MVTAAEPGAVGTLGATAAARLPGTDLDVSPLVLGGNMLGSRLDQDASFAFLDAFAEAGGSMVDTAAVYSDWYPGVEAGSSENTLGRWLRARPSSQMLIATKGGHPQPAEPSLPRLNRAALRADVEQSLTRLGIDTLPLWFTHRDDPTVPVADIIETIEGMRADGLLRWYGVSNWLLPRIAEAVDLRDQGLAPGFVATQSAYAAAAVRPDHLAAGLVAADGPTLAAHREAALSLFAYSAQAKGWFSDAPGSQAAYDSAPNRRVREVVRTIARETHNQPGQVALAALLHLDLPLRLIVGCSSTAQLHDTLGAVTVRLVDGQLDRIRHALLPVLGETEAPCAP